MPPLSITTTLEQYSFAVMAAQTPLKPAPIINMSVSIVFISASETNPLYDRLWKLITT